MGKKPWKKNDKGLSCSHIKEHKHFIGWDLTMFRVSSLGAGIFTISQNSTAKYYYNLSGLIPSVHC